MKTQPSDLADLEKRSSELDLREEFIERREELYDIAGKEGQVKVLDERIKYKQDEVSKLDDKISLLRDEAQQVQASIAKAHAELEADKEGIDTLLASSVAETGSQAAKTEALRVEAEALNLTIQERQTYQDNQEVAIEAVAKEANDRLNEMRFEADNIEARKYKALEDIVRHNQENSEAMSETMETEAKLAELTRTYEERAEEYRGHLQVLADREVAQKSELETQIQLSQARIQSLENREKVLKIKEVANDERAKSLDAKEQFLRSRYQIDGQEFNISL